MEWLKCEIHPRHSIYTTTKDEHNNSFNRSANSVAFMRETMLVIMAYRARLIRVLYAM
jgi:hypothetical protein